MSDQDNLRDQRRSKVIGFIITEASAIGLLLLAGIVGIHVQDPVRLEVQMMAAIRHNVIFVETGASDVEWTEIKRTEPKDALQKDMTIIVGGSSCCDPR